MDGAYTNYSSPIQTPTSAVRITLLYSRDEIVFKKVTGKDIYKYVYICIFDVFFASKNEKFKVKYYGFTVVEWPNSECSECSKNRPVVFLRWGRV